jgi:hypothetical protein
MEKENQIKNLIITLKTFIQEIPTFSKEQLYHKINDLRRINERFFKNNDTYESEFKYVFKNIAVLYDSQNDQLAFGRPFSHYQNYIIQTISTMLNEVVNFDIPSNNDPQIDKSINIPINVSQNQEQNQSQSITINFLLDIVKSSLTEEQFKDIQDIAKQENDPEKAKPKIFQKIINFGGNTFSNILASLITNPEVWKFFTS